MRRGCVRSSRRFLPASNMPIDLPPNSEPDADAVVLSKPFNELAGIPNSTDVRLVAEVSDTTLAF